MDGGLFCNNVRITFPVQKQGRLAAGKLFKICNVVIKMSNCNKISCEDCLIYGNNITRKKCQHSKLSGIDL